MQPSVSRRSAQVLVGVLSPAPYCLQGAQIVHKSAGLSGHLINLLQNIDADGGEAPQQLGCHYQAGRQA